MNPEIFREYDIRGVADKDLTMRLWSPWGVLWGPICNEKAATDSRWEEIAA